MKIKFIVFSPLHPIAPSLPLVCSPSVPDYLFPSRLAFFSALFSLRFFSGSFLFLSFVGLFSFDIVIVLDINLRLSDRLNELKMLNYKKRINFQQN